MLVTLQEIINMADFFRMQAREVVEDPAQAEVIVSDRSLSIPEGAEQIHSYDFSSILALMNA